VEELDPIALIKLWKGANTPFEVDKEGRTFTTYQIPPNVLRT